MIIDNVKVYTPDQKFVEGGLVLDQDRIEAVYTNETKPDLMAILQKMMFWMEKAPMPFQG